MIAPAASAACGSRQIAPAQQTLHTLLYRLLHVLLPPAPGIRMDFQES
ncbi:MAG UNVERIFIED_CONTAM: hypothetical protein LVR18_18330 [Planctomycetaceae bacterium]